MNCKILLKFIKNTILIIILTFTQYANALILENLIAENRLKELFQNKKICYYPGSFNILHKGHENTAYSVIEKKLCDYIIIYPLWGSDSYKKRIELEIRQEMIFMSFQEHSNIIVTKLPPEDLQNIFTDPDTLNTVKPKYNIEFIGIVGSDNALQTWKKPSNDFSWLGNLKIPDKYKKHSLGALMALPVSKFIVFIRNSDEISSLQGKLDNRKIIATIKDPKTSDISSSLIRELYLQSPNLARNLVNSKIFSIIKNKEIITNAK